MADDPALTDPAPPRIAPAVVIAGRYHLERRLGAGGGGTVWRCRDEKLEAIVALKIVTDDVDVERWRREVAMARRIADRNVCRVYDLGEADGARFVTMELVEGANLRAYVRPEGHVLSAAQASDLFAQVVAGAAAIHAAGIVHRDLKPENVVVANDGRAVIVDFGLAREPRAQPGATVTDAGVLVGTPRYMSPEQAAGDAVDTRTDVWALGLIGHELLTGLMPALPGPHGALGRRIDPAVDARVPGIAAVLARCLALAPEHRFADARELGAAIAQLGRRAPRRRWAGPLIAAGAAAGGAAIAVALTSSRAPAPAPTPEPAARPAVIATGEPKLRKVLEPARWPAENPMTIALHADGRQFAYTRAGSVYMDLFVGHIDGKVAPQKWALPKLRGSDRRDHAIVAVAAAGWFSNSSIALIGATSRNGVALIRLRSDGGHDVVYEARARFAAAVSARDEIAIGLDDDTIFALAPGGERRPIAQLERGERVLALAWSPDGARLAIARQPAGAAPAKLQIAAADGSAIRDAWSGRTAARRGMLLVWLDDQRIAFAQHEAETTAIYSVGAAAPAPAVQRMRLPGEYIGVGSAVGGTILALRGTAHRSVQISAVRPWEPGPVQAGLRGGSLAGWTADERVVFAAGDPGALRIASARPGKELAWWPGTSAGVEIPDTVAGDAVIAHRIDPLAPADRRVVIERIGPAGERRELARRAADDLAVRCAGDRAAPCVLAERTGAQLTIRELDVERGGAGEIVHQRALDAGDPYDVALSPDGRQLAIADGGPDATLVDRAAGTSGVRTTSHETALHALGFSPAGDLWVAARDYQGQGGLLLFPFEAERGVRRFPSRASRDDTARELDRPRPSPDGKQLAVTVRELRLHVAQITGL